MLNYYLNRLLYIVLLTLFSVESIADTKIREKVLLLDGATQATFNPSVTETPNACVLMIHGWVSNMNEVGGMFSRLAKQLSDNHIASIRVNIRGESEREASHYRLTSTFESRVEDAERGLAYLQQQCTQAPIGIVGFSLGGATAINLAGAHANDITSVALWSSAIDPAEIFTGIEPKSVVRDVINQGEGVFNGFEKITVTKQHYLGMQGYTPIDNFNNYHGALLAIRGTEDFVPMYDIQMIEAASSEHAEFRLIKGANHIFNTFDPGSEFDDQVIDYTTQWFAQTLQRSEYFTRD